MVVMRDEQQFKQLMMQYEQLKTGADDILQLIKEEDFDSAITMIKLRESTFLNCKCKRKYLELTPEQENQVNSIVDEIRALEQRNMDALKNDMENVKSELKKTQKSEKIQMAYDFDENQKGSIVNIQE
jgi:hypothetical protein